MQFDSVVGQDRVKDYLTNSIKKDNLTHGYIFEGPKNIGKLEVAKVFAQLILCQNSDEKPCEICSSCKKVNADSHPDIHILKLDENSIKRKDIDELQTSIYMKPYESKKKIYIIDDSHKMTLQAANTFLKTLEEPPEDTIIIMIAVNRDLLLDTIVSRCQIINFDMLGHKEVEKILIEEYKIEKEKAQLLAGYSKGNVYKALKIFKGEDKTLIYRDEIVDIVDKIFENGKSVVFDYEKYFKDRKDNIDEIFDILIVWFRDILFEKENISDMIVNSDKIEILKKHSRGKNSIRLAEIYDVIQKTYDDFNKNVNYNLIIDNMLLKIQEV
ncbi:MAG: DNA polymerase III subunit delta' [Eubacteriales bacterium]